LKLEEGRLADMPLDSIINLAKSSICLEA
jgi:hypothetical protein